MINIYITQTDKVTEDALKTALNILPQWRRDHVCKQKNISDKINGAFSYLLLQKLTADKFGIADTAPFTYGKYGKPYFSGSSVCFSISHCKNAVAAAISEFEIGLDIMDKRVISEKIAHRICSDEELSLFGAAADKQFFLQRLWCEKESLAKLEGSGFAKGYKLFDTAQRGADFFYEKDSYILALSGKKAETPQLSEMPWEALMLTSD